MDTKVSITMTQGCATLSALVFLIAGFHTQQVHAELSAEEIVQNYIKGDKDTREFMEYYLSATENAFSWSNVYLRNGRKEAPLYCPPADLALSGADVLAMLQKGVRESQNLGTAPVGLAILQVLLAKYPCPPR